MKNIIKICGAAMSALFLCLGASKADSGHIVTDQYMPVPAVAAYSSTFSIRADGLSWASAQVVVTSVTQTSPTFNDGRASSATLTVVSFAALSTATATGTLTISSNTALAGACLSGGGPGLGNFNVCNPANFAIDASTANTACNIATAINSFNVILATCNAISPTVVFATAPYAASSWNSFQLSVSTAGAIAPSTLISSSPITNIGIGTMSGGQDNQSFRINGKTFTAFTDFSPVTSNGQTATNIAAAIAAASATTGVTASAAGSVVFATSTAVGTTTNYAIFTSSQGLLTLTPFSSSGPVTATGNMIGGAISSYTINGSTLKLTGNNLGLSQGVWFSTGSAVGLSPLVWGTTYFAIPGTGSNVQLALTSTGAVAGLPIVFTSSAVPTTTDSFTLNVQTNQANSSVQWVASNDNLHWIPYTLTPSNIAIANQSYTTYFATGSVNNFDFGHFDYGYLGLNVIASTGAPTNVQAHVIGRN